MNEITKTENFNAVDTTESKFTAFGLAVKTALLRKGKPQVWLEKEFTKLTEKYMDSGLMYKILTGRRPAKDSVKVICEILDISAPEE